jgi:ferredoxin
MAAKVDPKKCTGCGSCAEDCPVEAIWIENDKAIVDEYECVGCGTCLDECQSEALSMD